MDIFQSLPKNIQILIIISPILVGISLLGYILHKGVKVLEKVSWFWLAGAFTITILYIQGLYAGTLSTRHAVFGLLSILSLVEIFENLREKERKKSR